MKKVQYRVQVTYSGYYAEYDNELNKVVGKISDSSGCGLGERDAGWYFPTMKEAKEAMAKIEKIAKYNLTVSIEEEKG